MVFSSLLFVFIFLPIALTLFYSVLFVTRHNKNVFYALLIFLSLSFYFWGSGNMLALLVASIVFNWFIGRQLNKLDSAVTRKYLLTGGIVINLSALLYFKYCRFILDTLGLFAGTALAPTLHPDLPVGISFYTFMTISYLVEVYRSPRQQASLLEFGAYLSLFPHLVAGPIVRFSEIANDLRQRDLLTINNFFEGVIRFIQGLAMKVLIANNLSPTVDRIFSLNESALTFGVTWLGAFTYTFQIYFDFAGYSAMAIGLALMFGFHFPENFNRPYMAPSITEFWRRWHMSLSRWLRDYIYIPLGGNKKGSVRTYINLFAVFLICGLWHGAAWTFVVWGIYQGLLLICERLIKNNYGYEASGVVGIALTFLLSMIGWVVFRSESLDQCWSFLSVMLSFSGGMAFINSSNQVGEYMDSLLLVSLLGAALFSFFPLERVFARVRSDGMMFLLAKTMVMATLLMFVTLYAVGNSYMPFIYFRF